MKTEIIYNDELHTYHVGGVRKLCVTDVLKGLGLGFDFTKINPALLENACL